MSGEPVRADTKDNHRAEDGKTTGATHNARTLRLILVTVCALLSLLCWFEHRSLRSLNSGFETQSAALAQIHVDAAQIRALSATPKRAVDRFRASDELLAQVETALVRAGVPLASWRDSVPQPPQPVANTPYKRVTTRLYLEGVGLEGVVGFAHHLIAGDGSLEISQIRLTAPRRGDRWAWNVDLGLSYLLVE